MTVKKTNAIYLTMVVVYLLMLCGLFVLAWVWPEIYYSIDFFMGNMLSELAVVVPVLLLVPILKGRDRFGDLFGLHKVKISTMLLTILYTALIAPLATVLNMISMLFVDNVVAESADDILAQPWYVTFLIVAVAAPLCEELVFRGAFYHGYRKSRNLVGAMLISSLLFGLAHLNFNQAPYAFGLGVMFALLCEATGSIWPTFLAHMIFNGFNVALVYLEDRIFGEELAQIEDMAYSQQEIMASIMVFAVIALITTTLALILVSRIAQNEHRYSFLRVVWGTRHNHAEQIFTWPLAVGIILCLAYMIGTELMVYFYY